MLVFLPGAAEIRRCQSELAELASERSLDILPLHGDLPARRSATGGGLAAGQWRGPARSAQGDPGDQCRRDLADHRWRDDGDRQRAFARRWAQSMVGLPTLRVQPICRAQATQRAGRAGRVAPGRCLRLYSRVDHDNRPEFEVPDPAQRSG